MHAITHKLFFNLMSYIIITRGAFAPSLVDPLCFASERIKLVGALSVPRTPRAVGTVRNCCPTGRCALPRRAKALIFGRLQRLRFAPTAIDPQYLR